jgi:hypothetical protein
MALLAAILFPVFSRVRENARRSSCQSNLKQIGLATIQYTQDYDERYPPAFDNLTGEGNFGQFLQPYVKNTRVFACPSNTNNKNNMANGNAGLPQVPASYAMNYHFSPEMQRGAVFPLVGLKISMIKSPSQKIFMAETTSTKGGFAWKDWGSSTNFGLWKSWGFAKHLSTWNCLFGDGHVKTMKPTATITPINMWGRFDANVITDGPDCSFSSYTLGWNINCDAPTDEAVQGLQDLEASVS